MHCIFARSQEPMLPAVEQAAEDRRDTRFQRSSRVVITARIGEPDRLHVLHSLSNSLEELVMEELENRRGVASNAPPAVHMTFDRYCLEGFRPKTCATTSAMLASDDAALCEDEWCRKRFRGCRQSRRAAQALCATDQAF